MSTQALNSWSRSSADIPIKQVAQNIWEVPQDYQPGMKVPARIYADEDLLAKMRTDRTIQQCVNVTHLDGIYNYAITMPDGHEGYGFPIGGVAATDYDEGLISPGGVGYDINCGVRLIRTNLTEDEVRPRLSQLVDTIFNFIPSGLGSRGQINLARSSSTRRLLMASIGLSTKDMRGQKIRRQSRKRAAWRQPTLQRCRAVQDRAEPLNLEVLEVAIILLRSRERTGFSMKGLPN